MTKTNSVLKSTKSDKAVWLSNDNEMYKILSEIAGEIEKNKPVKIPAKKFAKAVNDYYASDSEKDWTVVALGNLRLDNADVEYTVSAMWEEKIDPLLEKRHKITDMAWKEDIPVADIKDTLDEVESIIARGGENDVE